MANTKDAWLTKNVNEPGISDEQLNFVSGCLPTFLLQVLYKSNLWFKVYEE